MPTQVTNYQCPTCTGPLHFDGSSGNRWRLDVQLRTKRHHRQLLPELRQQKTGTEACGRDLEVSAVRRGSKRKILPRMRHEKAGSTGRWLDVQLRRGE